MHEGNGLAAVVVAPEVAARIVARRAAGEQAQQIGRDLHLTPVEVQQVLRDTEATVQATVGVEAFSAGAGLPESGPPQRDDWVIVGFGEGREVRLFGRADGSPFDSAVRAGRALHHPPGGPATPHRAVGCGAGRA